MIAFIVTFAIIGAVAHIAYAGFWSFLRWALALVGSAAILICSIESSISPWLAAAPIFLAAWRGQSLPTPEEREWDDYVNYRD